MDTSQRLLARSRRMGLLLLIGLVLLGYISLGLVYWQQTTQQANLDKEISKQHAVLAKPLAGADQLMADYKMVTDNNSPLAAITNEYTAFALLVGIAEKNGIDTSEGKLNIPSPSASETKVGESKFQLVSFHNIRIQGENNSVMAFLADLDSGKTLETMVLKRCSISYTTIPFTADEIEQREEFERVALAIKNMMADNRLSQLPRPMSFASGRAANLMGDDPATNVTVEGFPDNNTTIADKGYTGNASPRGGYVLYRHDIIPADNTSTFRTVSYIATLKTKYYYTVEADGTIRQFSGPEAAGATEYLSTKPPRIETIAIIDIDIYASRFEKK